MSHKNSVLADYLKVGLRVNSSGSWNFLNKLIREFLLTIFRLEALCGHPVPLLIFQKGCFPRSHTWFVYIQYVFLIIISSS